MAEVQRPPTRLYEVRTVHGEAYCAEGDVIESGDGWFTLWADQFTPALRVPEADIRAVRQVDQAELETEAEKDRACRPGCCVDNDSFAPTTCAFCGSRERCINHPGEAALARGVPGHPFSPSGPQPDALDPKLVALVLETLGIEMTPGGVPLDDVLHKACRELQNSEAARAHLRNDRKEARMWARHGYEIGQKHCGWTDHGVAPDWLTEGWPPHFDSCEHLKQMAAFDEALTRVRSLSTEPEVMNSEQESPDVWRHGYRCGVLAAKSAIRPRDEETRKP